MGQAWCKEKTSKAQDSKSPLDRVFVRCAHRIYPSLKEEGSVLGGATQRVTSSEIGYAGSPPREVLTRGRSIDSVDRPFQPSDWVDVNLEVPSTPRPSSALTNLTVDTNLYPTTTPTSSCSNLKDATPIPPPRRRKRNKGRPLPPKPDEVAAENGAKRAETGDEPLYSSVRSPKSSGDEQDGEEDGGPGKHRPQEDGRRTKEIYEHKVNGTGRIISSDMVLGRRALEGGQRRGGEHEEYEKFARSRTSKDSSTPNREEKRGPRGAERQIKDPPAEAETPSGHARTKNYSTVSLPNYDELDAARHRPELDEDREQRPDKTRKSRRPVRSSTGSLPAETFLSPFSEKTSVRLEDYIPRCDILSPYQVLEKLDCGANGVLADDFLKYDPSKSEDWELGDIGNCELNHQRRLSFEETSRPTAKDVDTVDFSPSRDPADRSSSDRDSSKSSVHLHKPDSFGKTPSPALGEPEYSEVDPNRSHTRYFDQPTLESNCGVTCIQEQPRSQEPFFLDETKHRSTLDTNPAEAGRADRSRVIFTRSLSNESEPNEDSYEPKELKNGSATLIKTISEESLPREMFEDQQLDDLFDAKHAKDAHNQLRKSLDDWRTSTPPPSPEPKIRPEILDADHSTLLKVLKDEAAEGSNLSSMTPSLTELEAALSDMLEREDSQDGSKEESKTIVVGERNVAGRPDVEISEHLDRSHSGDDHGDLVQDKLARKNGTPGCLKDALEDKRPSSGRKVSFCTWEESVAETAESREDGKLIHSNFDHFEDVVFGDEGKGVVRTMSTAELPPEKPSRLNRSLDDLVDGANGVPTPPRRRNKGLGVAGDKKEVAQNGSVVVEAVTNDRLI